MRKVVVALMFAVTAGAALIVRPVLAQDHVQKYREEDKEKTPAQEEADKRAQRAYQRSLNAVPDQKPVDPWGIARPENSTPKAAPKKTAAPKQAKPKDAAAN
ncbi:hypothetical protein JQ615_23100 [Bradyrhizobium jicamae]|uniref:Uncharacterized protein n=1 Tax=Bradyrhizobium jicamae TaxID=280332 RepID=A0ABS5FNP3_9BRAD|nr:hypothetical protein [Bradyrhizobium jicamae]MBR0798279.1 hypothetical protein [Bradyrhizobium jicamae]